MFVITRCNNSTHCWVFFPQNLEAAYRDFHYKLSNPASGPLEHPKSDRVIVEDPRPKEPEQGNENQFMIAGMYELSILWLKGSFANQPNLIKYNVSFTCTCASIVH